ncbi:hypothetical protein FLBR109950_03580 [Flavobacterium branchiophilum]|uniref:hypothetical protein n=1 Tax=Flavobacterium branchiophilum TaxID=55197 RepID=UPI0002D47527|nr:hypothetical protein [Flavobacterium branchiophilum]
MKTKLLIASIILFSMAACSTSNRVCGGGCGKRCVEVYKPNKKGPKHIQNQTTKAYKQV